MSPYVQVQFAFALSTAGAGFVLWHAAGSIAFFAQRPRWRTLAVFAALLFATPAIALAFESGFAAIAVAFYAGALVLPAACLSFAWRAPRREFAALGVAIAAPALALYAAFVAPNDLRSVEHELAFECWPADADVFTLVQISDLQTVGPCARQDEAVARINALEPDLIAVCGDYAAGPFSDPTTAVEAARAFLGALRARHGVVVVPGHSESGMLREWIFADLDLRVLNDQEFTLELAPDRKLRILGLGLHRPTFSTRRDAHTLTVAIGHVPDQSRELIGRGVDLHLAGHTHGGQVVIPGFGAPITLSELPREFARGLFAFGDHWLCVTPGIGMEGSFAPRVRLFSPPQIDVHRLRGGGAPMAWVDPPR